MRVGAGSESSVGTKDSTCHIATHSVSVLESPHPCREDRTGHTTAKGDMRKDRKLTTKLGLTLWVFHGSEQWRGRVGGGVESLNFRGEG